MHRPAAVQVQSDEENHLAETQGTEEGEEESPRGIAYEMMTHGEHKTHLVIGLSIN